MISDFIDVINSDRVTGWCFDDQRIDQPVLLSFYVDDTRIGETTASHSRPDLKALSFHPTGICGFDFTIPADINLRDFSSFKIFANAAAQPLKEFDVGTIQQVARHHHHKIFFMHVPKTAGTSFNTIAQTVFPEGSTAVHIESQSADAYANLVSEKMYLAGHLPLRDIQTNFDLNKLDLITLLREPYAHLHSHLCWVKNIGADPQSEFFTSHSAETRELALLLNTLDFRVPENLDKLVEGICGDLTSLFDNHQTRYFLDYRRIRVAAKDLDIAMAQLEKFKLIGCTERYREFIDAFCAHYAIECPAKIDKLNTSQGQTIFDTSNADVRAALLPFVKFDLVVYNSVFENR